jgi:hypothetical protein
MPGASTLQRGNLIFDGAIAASITPPATITTGTQTETTSTVVGLNVGDIVSWNQTSFNNALISVTNMYVSAANTLRSRWSTEGATQSSSAAETFLLEICRPENYSLNGLASLPTQIV